jgi:hypothetical protein
MEDQVAETASALTEKKLVDGSLASVEYRRVFTSSFKYKTEGRDDEEVSCRSTHGELQRLGD